MARKSVSQISLVRVSLTCKCPQCGRGHLFVGLLEMAAECGECHLQFNSEQIGDGAAAFIVLILGIVLVGAAIFLETMVSPRIWVHLCLWTPASILGSIVLLRPFKALMLGLHYKHGLLPAIKEK